MESDWAEEKDEVILAASLKDPAVFGLLVDRYQGAFLRKALGVGRQKEEAEDIVQETFVKISRAGDSFKKMPDIEFKSWAYKILMNTSFTHYQNLKKKLGASEYLDPDLHNEIAGEDGRAADFINDARTEVGAVINKMPEHLAKVLKLYYLDDKSYKEICEIENISIATLKMRLFRAKRLFHKLSAGI